MRAMGAMGKAVARKETREEIWGAVLEEECFWSLLGGFTTDLHVLSAAADVVSWCCVDSEGALPASLLSEKGKGEVLGCLPIALSHASLSLRSAAVDLLCLLPEKGREREGEAEEEEGGGGLVMFNLFREIMDVKMDALHSREAIYRIDTQIICHIEKMANKTPSEQKLLFHFLIGLFHLHFLPLWRPTQNALASISRASPSSFYTLISPFLVGRVAVDDLALPPLPAVPFSYHLTNERLRGEKWASVDLSSHFYREVRRLEEDMKSTAVGGDSFFESVWGVFCSPSFSSSFSSSSSSPGVDFKKFPLHKYFWVVVTQYFPQSLGKMTGDYERYQLENGGNNVEMEDGKGKEKEKKSKKSPKKAKKVDLPLALATTFDQQEESWGIILTEEEEAEYSFHPRGLLSWVEAKGKLKAILKVCERVSPSFFPSVGVFEAVRGVVGHLLSMGVPDIQVPFVLFYFILFCFCFCFCFLDLSIKFDNLFFKIALLSYTRKQH